MKNMYLLFSVVALLAIGCGQPKDQLAMKKAELEIEIAKLDETSKKIEQLRKEIAQLDTANGNTPKGRIKLVGITAVQKQAFRHYLELQGKVDAENIAWVTPRGMGGQVTAVYVKQGDQVKKGQLLLKLDDAVAKQQISQLEVQLDLAKDVYERRKNLWEKSIGTEIELLQAKNNVEALEKQLSILKEQLEMTNVYAQMSGVADLVTIKQGEFFSPSTASIQGIRIVNTNNLKIVTQVPENYINSVREGGKVEIVIPDIQKTISSTISVKGKTIDPSTRSFYIEAKIPAGSDLRPNQLALVKILDYSREDAISIPVNTLQTDEKGKYVMVVVNENGNKVAKKKPVETGALSGSMIEIKSGLSEGDLLITEGYQGLFDGQPVATSVSEAEQA